VIQRFFVACFDPRFQHECQQSGISRAPAALAREAFHLAPLTKLLVGAWLSDEDLAR